MYFKKKSHYFIIIVIIIEYDSYSIVCRAECQCVVDYVQQKK